MKTNDDNKWIIDFLEKTKGDTTGRIRTYVCVPVDENNEFKIKEVKSFKFKGALTFTNSFLETHSYNFIRDTYKEKFVGIGRFGITIAHSDADKVNEPKPFFPFPYYRVDIDEWINDHFNVRDRFFIFKHSDFGKLIEENK